MKKKNYFKVNGIKEVTKLIENGKKQIVVLLPEDLNTTYVSYGIAESICDPNRLGIIAVDNSLTEAECQVCCDKVKYVQALPFDEIIEDDKQADIYILNSLNAFSAKKIRKHISNQRNVPMICVEKQSYVSKRRTKWNKILGVLEKIFFPSIYTIIHDPIVFSIDGKGVYEDDSSDDVDFNDVFSTEQQTREKAKKEILDEIAECQNLRNYLSRKRLIAHEQLKLPESCVREERTEYVEQNQSGNEEKGKGNVEGAESLIESLERRIAFLTRALECCQISKEDLEKSFLRIETVRKEMQDQMYNDDGSENEEVLAKFENIVAEEIIKVTKNSVTLKAEEDQEEKLRGLLSDEIWNNRLEERSKSCLSTAEISYARLSNLNEIEAVDYSGVCILVSKALDVEIAQRVYTKYIEYLHREVDQTKWPRTVMKKEGNEIIDEDNFSLGSVAYVIGIDADGNIRNKYAYNTFFHYAKKYLYRSNLKDKEIEERIKNLVNCVEKVRVDYRNPTAHRSQINKITADSCMDYMLEVQKKLKEILIDMRF